MKYKKTITLSIVVLAIGGFWLWERGDGKNKVEYITEKVSQGTVRQVISITGEVVSKKSVNLAFEITGRINDVFVEIGDKVEVGDKIATLDKSALQYQLAEAQISLQIKEEQETLARRNKTWGVMKSEEKEAIKKATEQARIGVAKIRDQIAKTTLYAPISGTVFAKNIEKGEMISATASVINILKEDELEIESDVPESDINSLYVGQTANLELDAFSSKENTNNAWQAKLMQIYPTAIVISDVVYYRVKFELPNEYVDKLKVGMSVDLDVLLKERENVLMISEQAVKSENGKDFVQIKNTEKEIVKNKVKTGLIGDDGNIEIIEGLNIGDEVVVFTKEK